MSEPTEQELQVIMSHLMWVLGTELGLLEDQRALLPNKSFLQLLSVDLKNLISMMIKKKVVNYTRMKNI